MAQRQYNQCAPDNRLVAATLEAQWEAALRTLKQAEEARAQDRAEPVGPFALTAELQAVFTNIGARLPQLWDPPALSPPQRKALLCCLIDKIAVHRVARAQAQVRIVWRGGETTTLLVPVPVKSLAALPRGAEMAQLICALFAEGQSDAAMAARLTTLGHRSPSSPSV